MGLPLGQLAFLPQDVAQAVRDAVFHVQRGVVHNVIDTDVDYTLTADDHTILCDCTNGTVTISSDRPGTEGREIRMSRTAGANDVIFSPHDQELIDGATSGVLPIGSATVMFHDGNWYTV